MQLDMKPTGEDLVTPQEASYIMGVTAHTLRNWSTRGVITSYRTMGGHRRYKVKELLALRNRINRYE